MLEHGLTASCGVWLQIYYNDTRIQLLDLPGIIEGAAYGRGRGREVTQILVI